ncbi:MAG TPA: VOC family protein [Actinomycetota bacterium]|nr:VOC family protein [Actinomycetota bacterium]
MALKVTSIMLGVNDLDRSKKFYAEGLGCEISQDYPNFVNLNLGEGSSTLALYERTAAAADAGVSPEGSGFPGITFHYIVDDHSTVDGVIKQAVAAGGSIVKDAEAAQWGGYYGVFADPDGFLWKVASPQ